MNFHAMATSLLELEGEVEFLRSENKALRAQVLQLQTAGLVALADTLNTILTKYKSEQPPQP